MGEKITTTQNKFCNIKKWNYKKFQKKQKRIKNVI